MYINAYNKKVVSKKVGDMSEENGSQTERQFLHDISNQLVIAQGMGSFVLSALENTADCEEKVLKRMEKSVKAIEKMITMVKDRREFLKQSQTDTTIQS